MKALTADLEGEQQALDDVVAAIDDWATMTPAEGWTIHDQIAHLAFFDERAAAAIVDPAGFAASVEGLIGEDDVDEAHLTRGRAMTQGALLEWWRSERQQLIEALMPLDGRDRLPWYGPDMSVRSFATARLMETWAHGQDVVDAVGAEREPTDRLRHIAHLGVITRGWSYLSRGKLVPYEPVKVDLAAPGGGTWTWNEDADQSVSGPAKDFCLVVTQRRHMADTDLVVEGPLAEEWMGIAQAFAGPPTDGRPAGMFPTRP